MEETDRVLMYHGICPERLGKITEKDIYDNSSPVGDLTLYIPMVTITLYICTQTCFKN
jgi:hypothetical protein